MRPTAISATTPWQIDQLPVDWSSLITDSQNLITDQQSLGRRYPYLGAMAQYTNLCFDYYTSDEGKGGIFAHRFGYKNDDAFDEALSLLYSRPHLLQGLVARLFSRTRARTALRRFSEDAAELEQALGAAKFDFINPFYLTAMLAEYLFYYGMYVRFYSDHTAGDAWKLSQHFVESIAGQDFEKMTCFHTHHPWGAWFDPHSITDRSFVVINQEQRNIFLFCFSHSD